MAVGVRHRVVVRAREAKSHVVVVVAFAATAHERGESFAELLAKETIDDRVDTAV